MCDCPHCNMSAEESDALADSYAANKKKCDEMQNENLAVINAKIDESIVALKAIRSWINNPTQDSQTAANVKSWLFKLLTKIETIAVELKHYQ